MIIGILTFFIIVAVIGAILYGQRLIKTEKTDAVFGNPERAKGGVHWIIVGTSFLIFTWLYYSWDIAKAFYPKSANELCQVAKVNESLLSLKYLFPIEERSHKSTALIKRENINIQKKIVEIKKDHNWKFKNRLARCLRSQGSLSSLNNIMKNHFELRLPLDTYDVKNTLLAEKITGRSFVETLKNFNLFKSEYQVQGFLEGRMLEESPYGLSFPSIIASGPNATVLHYMKNDDIFSKGEMVLMDFGVRWMTMHADISRTVPASGKFNPMQKMLYEIVLKAQLAVQRTARRGITMNELNDCCWDSVNRDLEKTFKSAGGKMKLRYKDRPHGVSHLMGEQEHDGDPFRNYLSEPMREGWLISNEPGLYGSFKIRLNGKLYDEEIGIRIEDNLLITKTGCKNLSSSIPKTVRQIEKLMATKSD